MSCISKKQTYSSRVASRLILGALPRLPTLHSVRASCPTAGCVRPRGGRESRGFQSIGRHEGLSM